MGRTVTWSNEGVLTEFTRYKLGDDINGRQGLDTQQCGCRDFSWGLMCYLLHKHGNVRIVWVGCDDVSTCLHKHRCKSAATMRPSRKAVKLWAWHFSSEKYYFTVSDLFSQGLKVEAQMYEPAELAQQHSLVHNLASHRHASL